MNTLKSSNPVFIAILLCSLSCHAPDPNISETSAITDKFRLTNEEIKTMILTIAPDESEKSNFHIVYSEQFNDSTGMMRMWQNQVLANESMGICELFKVNESHVFVYDSLSCKLDVPDSLVVDNPSSAYINFRGPTWMVLVKRRRGQIGFFNVTYFSKYDESAEFGEDL